METTAKYNKWVLTEPYTLMPKSLNAPPAEAEAMYRYAWDLYDSLSLKDIARNPADTMGVTPYLHFLTAADAKRYAEARTIATQKTFAAMDQDNTEGQSMDLYAKFYSQAGAGEMQELGFNARLKEIDGNVAIVIKDVFATLVYKIFVASTMYRSQMERVINNGSENKIEQKLAEDYRDSSLDYIPTAYLSAIFVTHQQETPIEYLEIIKSKCPKALEEFKMAEEMLNKAHPPMEIPEISMMMLADNLTAALKAAGAAIPAKEKPQPIKKDNKRSGGRGKGMGKSANTVFNNLDILAKTALAWDRVWDGSSFKLPTIKNRNREIYGVVANLGHENTRQH